MQYPEAPRARRVLVVDDYPDAAELIANYVAHVGYLSRFATGGQEALAISAAFMPDVAVIDLDLPDLHGCEVAQALRATSETVFLIALTGSVVPGYRGRALAAGFDQFLLKPVVLSQLVTFLPANAASLRRRSLCTDR